MQIPDDLKKNMRAIDLAVQAAKKRQSPRTGLIHYYPTDELAVDTIPIYENFCFAFALFRLKTTESVTEGKEIVERLLAFQTENGNFPTYLHDFPKCWDFHLGLKIAPVLIHILQDFATVIGSAFKEKLELALKKAVQPPTNPHFEHRYLACLGRKGKEMAPKTAQEWFDSIVSEQLIEKANHFPIPYDRSLQAYLGFPLTQERGEPQPSAIEYLLAEKEGFSKRLLRDHPQQIYSALLYPFSSSIETAKPVCILEDQARILWKGDTLHSLIVQNGVMHQKKITFTLSPEIEFGRNDIFEALIFCDISEETSIYINDRKGMVFHFGDTVSIKTPSLQMRLRFELTEGEGDFCGHISRSNRSSQIACQGAHLYEAYDWQIGMRTLRRKGPCVITLSIDV